MSRPSAVIAAAAIFALAGSATPVSATHPAFETFRPGRTRSVTVAADGSQQDRGMVTNSALYVPVAGRAHVSEDGRFIAFTSVATNLIAGDTNGSSDVFVKDMWTGAVERVSVASDGTQANFVSTSPAMTPDGRYVAFASAASNLVPGDTNGGSPMFSTFTDVFVHDRVTGATERVSLTSAGEQTVGSPGAPHAWADAPSISADGRYVAFRSNATNLAPGAGGSDAAGRLHIYVRDRLEGTTTLASSTSAGVPGSGNGISEPSLSADGRAVAFTSNSTTLVPNDTNLFPDVFVKDLETGALERASVSSDEVPQNRFVSYLAPPSLSGDGRFVAWVSGATNLVPADGNGPAFIAYGFAGGSDIFVRDRVAGTTERVSLLSDGTEAATDFGDPVLSADGRYVTSFTFTGVHPDDEDRNAAGYRNRKVFIHDRVLGTTELLSVDDAGDRGNDHSAYPWISADGRFVTFLSHATDLVAGDANGVDDIFVRDRGPELGAADLEADPSGEVRGWATFAGAELAGADDPASDGVSIGGVSAHDLGAELTGLSAAYRPERGDLLLRWRLTGLPQQPVTNVYVQPLPTVAGIPSAVYALRFEAAGVTYEVRAHRLAEPELPATAASVRLFRCDPACAPLATLRGTIGAGGNEARASVPLAAVPGLGEGVTLAGAVATAGVATTLGEATVLDRMTVGPIEVPSRTLVLGVAEPHVPVDEVAFDQPVDLGTGGAFSTTVPLFDDRAAAVWARACLGEACDHTKVEVGP